MGNPRKIEAGALLFWVRQNRRQIPPQKYSPDGYYASHGMIATGPHTLVHEYPDAPIAGVMFDHTRGRDEEISGKQSLCASLAVHHKNPLVQEEIATIVNSSAFRATPFEQYDERRMDEVESERHRELIEFYRGYRNAMRIIRDEPISKKKGISCGNFVSYVIKAAIVLALFAGRSTDKLLEKMAQIELLRKASDNKLDRVHVRYLEEFEQLFLKTFKENGNNFGADTERIILELYRPVKHESVHSIFEHICENPEQWQVDVLICTKDETPYCVSFDVAKHLQSITITVTDEDLKQAIEESETEQRLDEIMNKSSGHRIKN